MGKKRRSSVGKKKGKVSLSEQKRLRGEERKAALDEKLSMPTKKEKRLGTQSSAGSLAALKKLRQEEASSIPMLRKDRFKDVDMSKLPQKREEQMAYAISMKPKRQDSQP